MGSADRLPDNDRLTSPCRRDLPVQPGAFIQQDTFARGGKPLRPTAWQLTPGRQSFARARLSCAAAGVEDAGSAVLGGPGMSVHCRTYASSQGTASGKATATPSVPGAGKELVLDDFSFPLAIFLTEHMPLYAFSFFCQAKKTRDPYKNLKETAANPAVCC